MKLTHTAQIIINTVLIFFVETVIILIAAYGVSAATLLDENIEESYGYTGQLAYVISPGQAPV